jgi:DNA-binding NarL/FixJ family response regulator
MTRHAVTNEELISALASDTVRNVCMRYGMSRAAIYNRAANDAALYAALGTPPTSGGRWRGSRQGNEEREREIAALVADGLTPKEIGERTGLALGSVRWWLRRLRSRDET